MEHTVNDLSVGQRGRVKSLGCTGALRRRIIDMGITPGAVIALRRHAPMGDPLEIHLRGYDLSIRKSEAEQIKIEILP